MHNMIGSVIGMAMLYLWLAACNAPTTAPDSQGNHYRTSLEITPDFQQLTGSVEWSCSLPTSTSTIRFLIHPQLQLTALSGPQLSSHERRRDAAQVADTLLLKLTKSLPAGQATAFSCQWNARIDSLAFGFPINQLQPNWSALTETAFLLPRLADYAYQVPFRHQFDLTLPRDLQVASAGTTNSTGPGQWQIVQAQPETHFALYFGKDLQRQTLTKAPFSIELITGDIPDSLQTGIVELSWKALAFYEDYYGNIQAFKNIKLVLPGRSDLAPGQDYSYAIPTGLLRVSQKDNWTNYLYSIGHEMAHFWWHFAEVPNQNYESFLNEGFAEFMCLQFLKQERDSTVVQPILAQYARISDQLGSIRVIPADADARQRRQYTYIKAAYTLEQLQTRIGPEKMKTLLQQTLQEEPQTYQAWLTLIREVGGREIADWYDQIF